MNGLSRQISIPVNKITVLGEVVVTPQVKAMIIFSHGSGSSRLSKRNQAVAKHLQYDGFGTLLFDLLTKEEDQHLHNRFDIDLLAGRLATATRWLKSLAEVKDLPIGYFGASTGAASALKAAVLIPSIKAVVCRGGRPDLAFNILKRVTAPTLFIVGSLDSDVLRMNQEAYAKLTCAKKIEIVEGATHLFEEEGKIEIVSQLASNWFETHLEKIHSHN